MARSVCEGALSLRQLRLRHLHSAIVLDIPTLCSPALCCSMKGEIEKSHSPDIAQRSPDYPPDSMNPLAWSIRSRCPRTAEYRLLEDLKITAGLLLPRRAPPTIALATLGVIRALKRRTIPAAASTLP